MNCLVTGASGFIGSALVERLAQEGHHVRAILHKTLPSNQISQVEYTIADMTDQTSLSSLIHDIDIVFHCAAIVKDFGPKKEIMNVNFRGTQHLVEACNNKIRRFIYLSHLHMTSTKKIGGYSYSKSLTDDFLLEKYHKENFPTVIIRPGNVYGPGATTWCLRPLKAIQKDHIALIDKGNGIFLHTYIDNLLDGLLSAMNAKSIEGKIIEITDGDNNTTWKTYLNDLAALAGKPPIARNLTKTSAFFISILMQLWYYLSGREPLLTPTAVHIFTNQCTISIDKATALLGYFPAIDYSEGMKLMALWLKNKHYI